MSNLRQFLRGAAKITYDNGSSGLTATDVQAAIDELDTSLDGAIADVADLRTLTGTADGETDLGTFTGTTIPDSSTVKAALQALETPLEGVVADAADLRTLSGTSDGDTDLGTFTGTTISDANTVKGALQELETHSEGVRTDADDLRTLSGTSDGDTDLGTFTGATISDNTVIKTALQELETALEAAGGAVDVLDWKNSVRVASTADIDLGVASDPGAIDGVTLANGDRILLKEQSAGAENGIYDAVTATDPTTWVRSADADGSPANEVTSGMTMHVEEGTASGDSFYVLTTNDPLTVGTTPLSFARMDVGAVTAGDGIDKVGNTISVDVNDIAGAGLENDGANNLRIATSAAGDGLGIAAGVLSVNVDDDTIETNADTLRVKADGIDDTHIDFGTGANQVNAADLPLVDGTGITATDVDAALVENRSAIDAVEDNGIASTNGSISTSGTIGADDLDVDVVFSTSGDANRSIEAQALASTANGEGASMVGVEDAASNWTATNLEGVLIEVDGRLDTLEAGGTLDWSIKTAAYTAVDGDKLLVDTSGGAVTITLPASPSAGDEVIIRDAKRTTESNAITVARNGEEIGGLTEDMTVDVNGAQVHLVYIDAAYGWTVEAA